jgi:hypothetical protein
LHLNTNYNPGKPHLCGCHPQSRHVTAEWTLENNEWQVIFFEQPEEGDNLHKRMLGEIWDCVLLFESTQKDQCLLVIDWHGGHAYRVVNLQIVARDMLNRLPSVKRQIRMY